MPQDIDLSLIVAMTRGRVIGRNNKLPWCLPSDLARFRQITKESRTIIMGYETYRSILNHGWGKPLPLRHHIVLTKNHSFAPEESVQSVSSPEAACEAAASRGQHACVIGGAQIYKLFMPFVQTAYITIVDAIILGDTFFPELGDEWQRISSTETKKWHEQDEYQTSYEVHKRVQS